jgi:hypothetical protein
MKASITQPMRALLLYPVLALLPGCAQLAAQQTVTNTKACIEQALSAPAGELVSRRLWRGDSTDTIAKLTDPKPLTPQEREALLRFHNTLLPCRQMILDHDNRFTAWETPYWQEFFTRTDAIHTKLETGEIPVGLANRLSIESYGQFQTEVSRAHANAVQMEEVQRQQTAQAMLQASAQMLAAQPKSPQITDTNCMWLGNMLNCTTR